MMKPILSKKAQVSSLAPAIISLVFAGFLLVMGLIILQSIRDVPGIGGTSALQNDSAFIEANKTLVGLATFGDFWEIIVLAIVITIVIGLLLTVFGGRRAR